MQSEHRSTQNTKTHEGKLKTQRKCSEENSNLEVITAKSQPAEFVPVADKLPVNARLSPAPLKAAFCVCVCVQMYVAPTRNTVGAAPALVEPLTSCQGP